MHAPNHVVDASKIDENKESDVVDFINKYITWWNKYLEISNLVRKTRAPSCKNL